LFQAFRINPDRLLPENTRDKIKNRGISLERGIADHIAGMTDEYATKMYERLFIPREGTIHQLL
jgi:dGTPase